MLRWFASWRAIVVLGLLAAIAWLALARLPDGRLHVWFLDVGQGDAILIQSPDGRQILVDGGPSPATLLSELGAVMPFWDRTLDLVVLTHGDLDHVSGLAPVLERYRVTAALDALTEEDENVAAWVKALDDAGVPRRAAMRGMRLAAGATVATVLSPADPTALGPADNNESVVLRVDYGDTSVLLTGDAEEEAEQAMMAAGVSLAADVLKVGHHGSAASSSADFLAQVDPEIAVISVGEENRFGHPTAEVLARLAGAQVWRTDKHGRIEVVSDGKRLIVRRER